MVPCIMLGDSIAVGVGQARPECTTVAKVGINSDRYVASMLPAQVQADTAVISLGVNDDGSLDTIENLRTVRRHVAAGSVVWLLPGLKPEVREMIRTVAAENGDRTIDTRPMVGRDHLHPTGAGYELIASQVVEGGVEVAYADPDAAPRAVRHRGPARVAVRGGHGSRHGSRHGAAHLRPGRVQPIAAEHALRSGTLRTVAPRTAVTRVPMTRVVATCSVSARGCGHAKRS